MPPMDTRIHGWLPGGRYEQNKKNYIAIISNHANDWYDTAIGNQGQCSW